VLHKKLDARWQNNEIDRQVIHCLLCSTNSLFGENPDVAWFLAGTQSSFG
jgi:hypothetical protein